MPIKNFKTRSILILIISPTGNSTLVLGISSEAKVQHGVRSARSFFGFNENYVGQHPRNSRGKWIQDSPGRKIASCGLARFREWLSWLIVPRNSGIVTGASGNGSCVCMHACTHIGHGIYIQTEKVVRDDSRSCKRAFTHVTYDVPQVTMLRKP